MVVWNLFNYEGLLEQFLFFLYEFPTNTNYFSQEVLLAKTL